MKSKSRSNKKKKKTKGENEFGRKTFFFCCQSVKSNDKNEGNLNSIETTCLFEKKNQDFFSRFVRKGATDILNA